MSIADVSSWSIPTQCVLEGCLGVCETNGKKDILLLVEKERKKITGAVF